MSRAKNIAREEANPSFLFFLNMPDRKEHSGRHGWSMPAGEKRSPPRDFPIRGLAKRLQPESLSPKLPGRNERDQIFLNFGNNARSNVSGPASPAESERPDESRHSTSRSPFSPPRKSSLTWRRSSTEKAVYESFRKRGHDGTGCQYPSVLMRHLADAQSLPLSLYTFRSFADYEYISAE